MMSSGFQALHRQVEIGFEILTVAVDDALGEPIFELFGPALFLALFGGAVLEQRDKGVQRIVASIGSIWRRRSKIRSSAICTSSGGMRCNGMIREKCTMAPVSPRRRAWSRKTEFRICRAGGFRPNEMLDRPRMIWHSGIACAICSIASNVYSPSLRSSSLPVQIVKVSGSNSRSDGGRPCLWQAKS